MNEPSGERKEPRNLANTYKNNIYCENM